MNTPFYVQAYKHRTLDDDIVIGYRYNGTIRTDREWANSKGCNVIERVSITAFSDLSLTRELCNLIGQGIDLSEADGAYTMEDDSLSKELIVETYEADKKQIDLLNKLAKEIRGE